MQISRDVVASGVAGGALRRLTECDVVASGVAGGALHSLMSLDACLPAAQQILPDLGSTLGVMRRCRHNFTLRPPLRPRLVRRAVGVGAVCVANPIRRSASSTRAASASRCSAESTPHGLINWSMMSASGSTSGARSRVKMSRRLRWSCSLLQPRRTAPSRRCDTALTDCSANDADRSGHRRGAVTPRLDTSAGAKRSRRLSSSERVFKAPSTRSALTGPTRYGTIHSYTASLDIVVCRFPKKRPM